MPHQVSCPACGVPMQLPDDLPGRSFQCVRCGAALVTTEGGQKVTQPRPMQPANPFAESPTGFGYPGGYAPGMFAPGYLPPLMSREIALAKVRGPALMMQGLGWLLVIASIPAAALYFVVDHDQHPVSAVVSFGAAPVALLLGGFAVFCGSQLNALRSYYLVLATIIVMLIVGLLVCPLLALPGIWPMIVMLDSGVKANFGAKPAAF
jgi:hypothetical protein